MNSLKISVIIPTFNRISSLLISLKYLEKQDFNEKFEVIIIDDWSTDLTQIELKKFKTKKFELVVLKQENKKQAIARNLWVFSAKSDLIIFLQDDIWAEKNLLSSHFNFHKKLFLEKKWEKNIIIWKTIWTKELQKDRFHRFLDWTWKWIFPGQLFNYNFLKTWKEANYWYFYTNNLSIKKSFFQSEKFNENFNSYWWEDIEIWYRFQKKWGKIFFEEKALAFHNHKYDFFLYLKREENVSKSLKKFIKIHPKLKNKYKISWLKKCIFYIFSQKIFLFIFKYFWKESFWYFSAKKIWLKNNW